MYVLQPIKTAKKQINHLGEDRRHQPDHFHSYLFPISQSVSPHAQWVRRAYLYISEGMQCIEAMCGVNRLLLLFLPAHVKQQRTVDMKRREMDTNPRTKYTKINAKYLHSRVMHTQDGDWYREKLHTRT